MKAKMLGMTMGHGLAWSISFTGNLKGGVRMQGELGRLLGMIDNAARAKGVIPKQFSMQVEAYLLQLQI
jgi:hypothetical protein